MKKCKASSPQEQTTIEFLKLKIQDFEKGLISISKLSEDKIIKQDINTMLEDVTETIQALNTHD